METPLELEGDVGSEIVRRVGPRTQDVVQVARQGYFCARAADGVAREKDVVDAIDQVVRNEEPLIRNLWCRNQRNSRMSCGWSRSERSS